jgi:hypothetical protein
LYDDDDFQWSCGFAEAEGRGNTSETQPVLVGQSPHAGRWPPFIKVGKSIRYNQTALLQWLKSRER